LNIELALKRDRVAPGQPPLKGAGFLGSDTFYDSIWLLLNLAASLDPQRKCTAPSVPGLWLEETMSSAILI